MLSGFAVWGLRLVGGGRWSEGDWELMGREDGGGGGWDLDDGWELVERDGGDGGHDAPVTEAGRSWGGALRRALFG